MALALLPRLPLPSPALSQLASSLRRCLLHATPAVAKHNKPRTKAIPVSMRQPSAATGGQATQLSLTPEALKKLIDERNAAEAAKPWRGRHPEPDSCHMCELFEPQRFALPEILRRHREFACPEMLNNPAGKLQATCLFDMSTARQGKFLAPFSKVISLPHLLPESIVRRHAVLAFCGSPELAAELKAKGATDAGGADLVAKLETGVYIQENFDYAICHPNFWPSLLKARKLLKDAMPAQRSPQVTENLEAALQLFKFGLPAKLTQAGDLPDRAQCKLPFALLDWPDYNAEMNMAAVLSCLLAEKPKRSAASNFLLSVAVTCPPSDEVFLLDLRPYLAASTAASAETASAEGGQAQDD